MSRRKPYFERVTSVEKIFIYIKAHKIKDAEHLRMSKSIDAPSNWDTRYLYKTRVICRRFSGDFLGITIKGEEDNAEWNEVINPFPERLKGRLYSQFHQYFLSGTAAEYWQALWVINMPMPDEPMPGNAGAEPPAPASKRVRSPRTPRQATKRRRIAPGFVNSEHMTVDDSPSKKPGLDGDDDGFDKNDSTYVSADAHDERDLPEDATVNLMMAAIKHALTWYGPQKGKGLRDEALHDGALDKELMLSGSSVRYTIKGKIPSFSAGVTATPDGEIQAHMPVSGQYTNARDAVVALLEAKKKFKVMDVPDGKAVIPDNVLAQVVGEALALRGTNLRIGDTIVVIVAIRHLVCFLSVQIPAAYCQGPEGGGVRDAGADCITVTSTPWLDHNDEGDRKNILHNVARIVIWSREKEMEREKVTEREK
ncbi:hypothetical protein MAPG_10561 [Magnaporthiopsis poae ATCC 64411]|uniref:Uncharacterized protein n=1 Tax=Magnaporthiopsis poae (strain ATCC 64411 / 73-15) TaxID=644358 RepID=A0A0C4ECX2_MAGP6|nr:hypothetical protein MAPG_10561 [Magnaporthiopsis poae ATCC 64411]